MKIKKIITITFLIVNVCNLFAQSPGLLWQKSMGGTSYDEAKIILPIQDGYILAGDTSSGDGDVTTKLLPLFYDDIWISKLDNLRNIVWQKCLGGNYYDNIGNISKTNDGGYIIIGTTGSNDIPGFHSGNVGTIDIFVVKLDSFGTIEWKKCYGGSLSDQGFDIIQTSDGGYMFSGTTYSFNGDLDGFFTTGYSSCWIVKINSLGTIDWQKRIGGNGEERAKSIKQLSDGGYVFTGYTTSTNDTFSTNHGNYDILVVRTDNTGNLVWQKCFGGTNNETSENIQLTNDGGFIIAGTSNSNDGNLTFNNGGNDFWILKLDTIGNLEWQKSIGTSGQDTATYIQQTSDNNFVVSGIINKFQNETTNIGDAYIVKLDVNGNEIWNKTLGGTLRDQANSITQGSDGGYLVSGFSFSNDGDLTVNNGASDFWIVKLSSDNLVTTSFLDNKNFLIYPNPSESTITVSDDIIDVKIYALDGKNIEFQNCNNSIDVSKLANGTYIIIGKDNNGKTFENKLIKK
jgi:hypothetical protein